MSSPPPSLSLTRYPSTPSSSPRSTLLSPESCLEDTIAERTDPQSAVLGNFEFRVVTARQRYTHILCASSIACLAKGITASAMYVHGSIELSIAYVMSLADEMLLHETHQKTAWTKN